MKSDSLRCASASPDSSQPSVHGMKVPGSPEDIVEVPTNRDIKFSLNLVATELGGAKNLHVSNLQSSEVAEI